MRAAWLVRVEPRNRNAAANCRASRIVSTSGSTCRRGRVEGKGQGSGEWRVVSGLWPGRLQCCCCCSAVAAVAAVAAAVAAWLAYGLLMHQRQIAFCEAVDVNTIQARFAIHTDAGRRLCGYGV